MAVSIFTQTRTRFNASFTRNGVTVDPQIVLYDSVFTAATVGVDVVETSFVYGATSDIVRTAVGVYYVEVLTDAPGKYKFTWRSVAFGEELVQEQIVNVVARTVAV